MKFRRQRDADALDVNLIPLIDVLLVILIFLAATTSFTRLQALQVELPQAGAQSAAPDALRLAVSREGLYALGDSLVEAPDVVTLAQALRQARAHPEQALIILADAESTHQSVMRALEAAREAGIVQISFAAAATP